MKDLDALTQRWKENKDWLDYRAGLICSLLANVFRGKNDKSYSPRDFMPGYQQKPQTAEQMLATVKLLNAAYGGT